MALNFSEIIFAVLIPAMMAENEPTVVPRVVQGQSVAADRYPYVVCLERSYSSSFTTPLYRICTGSLVTDQWILTAAHCLMRDTQVVRYGDMTIPHHEVTLYKPILKKVPHPGYLMIDIYQLEFGSNDIGMVLVEKIPLNTYARVSAEDYKTLAGRSVFYAGFGYTVEKDLKYFEKFSEKERESAKKIILEDERRPLQIGEGVLYNRESLYMVKPMMYVSPKCETVGQTANYGDSGGPMFYRDKIIAVCSGGRLYDPKSRSEMFGAYTPVSPFIQWIHDVVSTHP